MIIRLQATQTRIASENVCWWLLVLSLFLKPPPIPFYLLWMLLIWIAELHASNIGQLLMPTFCFYICYFSTVLHRDSAKPNSLYFSLHLWIAWSRSFLCASMSSSALLSWHTSSISVPTFTKIVMVYVLFVVAHILFKHFFLHLKRQHVCSHLIDPWIHLR